MIAPRGLIIIGFILAFSGAYLRSGNLMPYAALLARWAWLTTLVLASIAALIPIWKERGNQAVNPDVVKGLFVQFGALWVFLPSLWLSAGPIAGEFAFVALVGSSLVVGVAIYIASTMLALAFTALVLIGFLLAELEMPAKFLAGRAFTVQLLGVALALALAGLLAFLFRTPIQDFLLNFRHAGRHKSPPERGFSFEFDGSLRLVRATSEFRAMLAELGHKPDGMALEDLLSESDRFKLGNAVDSCEAFQNLSVELQSGRSQKLSLSAEVQVDAEGSPVLWLATATIVEGSEENRASKKYRE